MVAHVPRGRTRDPYWRFAVLVAAWGALGGSPFLATPARAAELHQSPHLEHTRWLFGPKIVQFNSWEPGHGEERNKTVNGVGAGFLLERTVIEGWLEIEVSASGVAADGNTIVPIDVLFKKSFELGRFNPYVGIGPSISIDIEDGDAETSAGCAFAAGTYFWLSDHVGLDFDVDYSLVSKNGTAQELIIAVGPVLRF